MKPSAVPIVVKVVPTVVWVGRRSAKIPQMTTPQKTKLREQRQEVPQMTCPQERQLKEQRQEVKEEHYTRFPKGEEHLHFDGNVYKDQMETIASPQHLQHLEQHLQHQQHQTQEGLQATK